MSTSLHDLDPDRNRPTAVDASPCRCASRRDAFRAVGTLGVVAAAAGGLAACGGGSDETGSPGGGDASGGSGASGGATASEGSSGQVAIQPSEVPVGGGTVLDDIKVVVTQPTDGDFKAFSAICTHQGCTVGGVADGKITCPCHGSQFDIATGAVVTGPATAGLETKTVTVGADGLTIS